MDDVLTGTGSKGYSGLPPRLASGRHLVLTVTPLERGDNDLLPRHTGKLRAAVRRVRDRHTFTIHARVVLPDHLHRVLEPPPGDTDFALRWRPMKSGSYLSLPNTERRSATRRGRGERGIWQRRYREPLNRDDPEYRAHMDYVHFNPVRHGVADSVATWPHSTFHRLVKAGIYPAHWSGR